MSSEPIWARPEPGARKPAHTREAIAQAAVAIADAEGLEAVSMRRVANELGAGTMTLYHYVRTKSELFALMDDAVMKELILADDEMGETWREGLTAIAYRSREVAMRHPWLFEAKADSPGGPGTMRHVEQSLAAAARTGLGPEAQMELTQIVDDYVFGHIARIGAAGDIDLEEWIEAFAEYFDEQFRTGEYPHMEAFAGDDLRGAMLKMADKATDDRRFERGLQMLLDGIEMDLERRRRGGGAPRGRARTSGGSRARRASG